MTTCGLSMQLGGPTTITIKPWLIFRHIKNSITVLCIETLLPVSGRDAVFGIEFPSGAGDIGTLSPVAGHREMQVLIQIDGHQVATRVLHVHLIQQHVGK